MQTRTTTIMKAVAYIPEIVCERIAQVWKDITMIKISEYYVEKG